MRIVKTLLAGLTAGLRSPWVMWALCGLLCVFSVFFAALSRRYCQSIASKLSPNGIGRGDDGWEFLLRLYAAADASRRTH